MPTLGQYTLAELKAAIDAAITSKTLPGSILNTDDGALRKNIVEDLFLKIQNISPGPDGTVIVDGTTIIGDGLNTPLSAIFNQEGKYIISGGSSWSGTGLVYDVSILNYFFNGIKPSTQAQITLDASDATYDRFDAIVVSEDGVISIIKGTADANPITPIIPENQLLVQYILVGAGTLVPAITQEIIHADEPTTNWTASNYTTAGGVVGTTDFTATTPTPFQGADCILNTRDGRTGVRFVRDTAINLADYTYVALRVFIPTALATNKSLVLRFENSAGVLIGTGINLFSYGINRNLIGVWQMAYVPTYAFGAINSIKGLKIILSGGTVGVTAQWAIDYVLLSTGSTPSANLPTITVSENGVAKGNTENIDFVDGDNTTVDVVKDNVSGKIKVKVNASGGGGGIAIGDTVTDADAASILYVDGSGNLTQDAGFTRDGATGNTNISATYADDTFSNKLDSEILTGATGIAQTLSSTSGDTAFIGIYRDTSKGTLGSKNEIVFSDGTTVIAGINMNAVSHSIYSYNSSSFTYGLSLVSPEESNLFIGNDEGNKIGFFVQDNTTFFGNRDSGNNTRITIDDVNEQITISNLSAYDDDTAAGVGGLTAGMVYMTTGSGSAPLNAAGILMIKQ